MSESARKTCPHCSEEILQSATKCKHCGSYLGVNRLGKILSKIFLTFVLVGMASCYGCFKLMDHSTKSRHSPGHEEKEVVLTLTKDQLKPILDMEKEGFLRLSCNLNQVYIEPRVWMNLDLQVKENFSRALAIYCCNKKGKHIYWIEVFNKYNGKRLAKWSRAWGFSIE